MDSDQFDVDVPDTIPAYITRRHQKTARRRVARAHAPRRGRGSTRVATWVWALAGLLLIIGIVALWSLWPSPTKFVVVPTVVLVAGVCAVTFAVVRRSGLDSI